jgi:hypothetical protein
MLTKLGTYLVLTRIWNPIDFQGQGHRVKFLGEGLRHSLRCPCSLFGLDRFCCIMLVTYYYDHNDILFLDMTFTNHEWYAPKLKNVPVYTCMYTITIKYHNMK